MSKNIIEYLPSYLKNIYEFQKIYDVENIELESIQNKLDSILNEIIVDRASEYGISRYEKIFNIINKKSTLYERRFIIESIFMNRIPFTLKWLENKLKQIADDKYVIDIDYNNYALVIRISYLFANALDLLEKDIRKSIPANLSLTMYLNENEKIALCAGGATIEGCYEELWEV